MDDTEVIRTYGNKSLPEGTPERPLVTFAVFAYNQEKYIREAVEGAFAQTYSPLEIILSDDCSTDRTFEIMEEMAREYEGPHRVVVRKNAFNLGTAMHVQVVFASCAGILFIVAAGDDISLPCRVETLFRTWEQAGRPEGVVHSGRIVFGNDVEEHTLAPRHTPWSGQDIQGYAHGEWLPAAAPTCAFTRGVFERFPPLSGGSLIEDAPLFFRAALIGEFIPCKSALIRQRIHSHASGTGHRLSKPERWNRFLLSKLIAFSDMLRDLRATPEALNPTLRWRIERQILYVLNSAPGLFVPVCKKPGILATFRLLCHLLLSKTISRTARDRILFAVAFFELERWRAVAYVMRLARKIRSSGSGRRNRCP